MDEIGAAIRPAQRIAPCCCVEDQRPLAGLIGQRQRGRIIGQQHDEADVLRKDRIQFPGSGFGRRGNLDRVEILPHEAAGGVVVLDRQPRPGKAEIRRRDLEPRDRRQCRLVHPQHRGADQLRLVGGLGGGWQDPGSHERQHRDCDG